LSLAAGGCAVAGAVVLFAAGREWVRYVVAGGHASAGPSGHDVAAGASALGFVMLAGVVALPATRGWLRRAVGVIVAAAGAGTIALAANVLADPGGAAGSRYIGVFSLSANPSISVRATGWPWADVCAGVLAALVGGFAVLRSGGWPAMGRRYESGGRAAQPSSDASSMWDRLDQGDDPTA
jgi:uncharacterized membrane protein (TIGR02234 family)